MVYSTARSVRGAAAGPLFIYTNADLRLLDYKRAFLDRQHGLTLVFPWLFVSVMDLPPLVDDPTEEDAAMLMAEVGL